ncbi:hypothetical protein GCM10007424_12660 [Flavobacterium suaedae]|uniref:Uncharacterized protein n=1 Tax=Flavobacterium suaedae TaxID=1767027 RepID=A0ABQ1JS45_9FLAO|nr:hypothetical protein [Flavobacterium suaedae]GGB74210.1 hypothetical protein GCM10007424_12660 [Flavobacterium suaedae]
MIFQKIARSIIKISFDFSIKIIESLNDMEPYKLKERKLSAMTDGTLGKAISNCLRDNNLSLVPGYESHDLKHVILGYEMTPVDEIRMQAFMLGNRNYTLPCFIILIFGMVLLPSKWSLFFKDFNKGRNAKPIALWSVEEYADKDLSVLQYEVFESASNPQNNINIVSIISYIAMFAGVFGMLFCLPFLFSVSVADLVGAGFPFVGGAILFIGGLNALSNVSRQH